MTASDIAIVTDSTCDLPADVAAEHAIHVVPLVVQLGSQSFRDGIDLSPAEFYRRLEQGQHGTTSQPSVGAFAELYRNLLSDHAAIVSIHISAKLSGTVASAASAAAEVDAKRIHVVDSKGASAWLALHALAASHLANSGCQTSEVLATLEELGARTVGYFTVHTLEYLHRGGRIGAAQAFMGSILQIRPVLALIDGEIQPVERLRAFERAVARIVHYIEELAAISAQGLCIGIAHASNPQLAQGVAQGLDHVAESLFVVELGPVVGTHGGPGLIGVCAYPAELAPLGFKPRSAGAH